MSEHVACSWVEVECNGQRWQVAPLYIGPVGIGEAAELAKAHGCELPSPELVDAIWHAADLKVEPLPRQHNGTVAQMASPEVYMDQARRLEAQLAGRSFRLIAGTHKDVVIRNGRVGLYGWHRMNGKPIQPFFAGHALSWKDYSQGLRLAKRVT
jgi:hypothetical protein